MHEKIQINLCDIKNGYNSGMSFPSDLRDGPDPRGEQQRTDVNVKASKRFTDTFSRFTTV